MKHTDESAEIPNPMPTSSIIHVPDFAYNELLRKSESHDKLVKALEEMIERYTDLVNCGDCGNWNPEEEKSVIAAREALAAAKGE